MIGFGMTCTASDQLLLGSSNTKDVFIGDPTSIPSITMHNPTSFTSLVGAGTLPVCATDTGLIYLGTNTAGVLGC